MRLGKRPESGFASGYYGKCLIKIVAGKQLRCVISHTAGLVGEVIAAHVRSDSAKTCPGKKRNLPAPGVPA